MKPAASPASSSPSMPRQWCRRQAARAPQRRETSRASAKRAASAGSRRSAATSSASGSASAPPRGSETTTQALARPPGTGATPRYWPQRMCISPNAAAARDLVEVGADRPAAGTRPGARQPEVERKPRAAAVRGEVRAARQSCAVAPAAHDAHAGHARHARPLTRRRSGSWTITPVSNDDRPPPPPAGRASSRGRARSSDTPRTPGRTRRARGHRPHR